MFCDYHVHTEYSDDSCYLMEDVIRDAIVLGIKEICFTDHVDYGIKLDWDDPNLIIKENEKTIANVNYPQYFQKIDSLTEKYCKQITLKKGIEFLLQMHTLAFFTHLFPISSLNFCQVVCYTFFRKKEVFQMTERQSKLIKLVNLYQKIEVSRLAELLDVSQVTIRKDLDHLEEEGLLSREHGYALIKNANDINTRLTINYDKKIEIATKAAEMVSNGETVMLESGSTCTLLAEQLAKLKKDITIITNSAYIAIRIRDLPIRKVILLGGEYQKEYQGMVGPLVRKCAKEFYVDKFFVGTDGFIPDAGFTCDDLMRVETMKYMEGSANRMIILADSSKFSQKGVVIQTTFSEIDTVCTDADIPEDALENLKRHNINVEIAE